MNAKNTYSLITQVANAAYGKNAPFETITDTQSLISTGDYVMSSPENVNAFYGGLYDVISDIEVASKKYSAKYRPFVKDEVEFGAFRSKIRVHNVRKLITANDAKYTVKDGDAITNPVAKFVDTSAKLFSKVGYGRIDMTNPDADMLKYYFQNVEQMGAFLTACMTAFENAREESLEAAYRTAFLYGIAYNIGYDGDSVRAINLFDEYNKATGKTITYNAALTDVDFLRWCCGFIDALTNRMALLSNAYTAEADYETFSTKGELRISCLDLFRNAIKNNLLSITYHNDKLVGAEITEDTFEFLQTFNAIPNLKQATQFKYTLTDGTVVNTAETEGKEIMVVCHIQDVNAMAILEEKMKANTKYYQDQDVQHTVCRWKEGFAYDDAENSITLYFQEV